MMRPIPFRPIALGLMAAAGLTGAALAANTPAKPAAAPPTIPQTPAVSDYEVTGFRSARFGMTQAEARAAIAKDFGDAAKITETANPIEGTHALQAAVPSLPPGPGAATVTYIFGASSKTLAHVNVVWVQDGEPTKEQRDAVVAAAVQLTDYFQTLPAAPKATAGVTPTGPNSLLMYAAVDKKGGGVEIDAEGISYQSNDKTTAAQPAPKGPALLRISYLANVLNPDVYKVKPGSF
jgi:hypothetical protein